MHNELAVTPCNAGQCEWSRTSTRAGLQGIIHKCVLAENY